jgi:hypothetical protein
MHSHIAWLKQTLRGAGFVQLDNQILSCDTRTLRWSVVVNSPEPLDSWASFGANFEQWLLLRSGRTICVLDLETHLELTKIKADVLFTNSAANCIWLYERDGAVRRFDAQQKKWHAESRWLPLAWRLVLFNRGSKLACAITHRPDRSDRSVARFFDLEHVPILLVASVPLPRSWGQAMMVGERCIFFDPDEGALHVFA